MYFFFAKFSSSNNDYLKSLTLIWYNKTKHKETALQCFKLECILSFFLTKAMYC